MQIEFFSGSKNKLPTNEKRTRLKFIIHQQKLLQDSVSVTSQFSGNFILD